MCSFYDCPEPLYQHFHLGCDAEANQIGEMQPILPHVKYAEVQSRLNRLIEMGIVEHIGRKKYVLARSLYAATGKTGVHTRHVGLDRDTNKELLLKHIRQNNEVGTPFKELQQVLPGLDRNQIRVLMRELRESGKVFCEGTTSAARWFASK